MPEKKGEAKWKRRASYDYPRKASVSNLVKRKELDEAKHAKLSERAAKFGVTDVAAASKRRKAAMEVEKYRGQRARMTARQHKLNRRLAKTTDESKKAELQTKIATLKTKKKEVVGKILKGRLSLVKKKGSSASP
jgi:hypothetical protein